MAQAPVQIAGYQVSFPYKPYGTQLGFMNQFLRAVDQQGNALLEAPTGSGKTACLLASALAWQKRHLDAAAAARSRNALKSLKRGRRSKDSSTSGGGGVGGSGAAPAQPDGEKEGAGQQQKQQQQQQENQAAGGSDEVAEDGINEADEDEEVPNVPKIYYATRTHSQIAQVIRELKRMGGHVPRMAVLGSKPHYCINNAAIRTGNVDAACDEMMKDGRGCRFAKKGASVNHVDVKVHDLEDLARVGKRLGACPYYASRHLATTADLVFCPYSYLLDPVIRRATGLEAEGAVVIFDEAHNIEDISRESGSAEIDLETLKLSWIGLERAAIHGSAPDTYQPLADAVMGLIKRLRTLAGEAGPGVWRVSTFEAQERVWAGKELMAELEAAGLGPNDVPHLKALYDQARAAEDKATFNTEGEAALEEVPKELDSARAGGLALGTLSRLLSTLELLYEGGPNGQDAVCDYRLAVQRAVRHRGEGGGGRGSRKNRRFVANAADEEAAQQSGAGEDSWSMTFCLWLLNPAVVFNQLSSKAWSVVLASGTLSPLDSFAGELRLPFHVQLEAPHVVDMRRQVWAGVLPNGPDGRVLTGTYKEADTLDFQDSVGTALLSICRCVPGGVLMFMPSYALMDKLTRRWQSTGLWKQLLSEKAIFSEPRQAGDAFDKAITSYYQSIRSRRGGLFLAVCRGKASEGIDFADDNARAVVVLSIPYPNLKDTKVNLKREYNNAAQTPAARAYGQRQQSAGGAGEAPPRLLSGEQWYGQQAFRALNQAIGRCIRHRFDYGAIILLDERFKAPRNQASLSKWVRSNITTHASFDAGMESLRLFFERLAADPPGPTGEEVKQQAAAAMAGAGAGGGGGAPAGVGKGWEQREQQYAELKMSGGKGKVGPAEEQQQQQVQPGQYGQGQCGQGQCGRGQQMQQQTLQQLPHQQQPGRPHRAPIEIKYEPEDGGPPGEQHAGEGAPGAPMQMQQQEQRPPLPPSLQLPPPQQQQGPGGVASADVHAPLQSAPPGGCSNSTQWGSQIALAQQAPTPSQALSGPLLPPPSARPVTTWRGTPGTGWHGVSPAAGCGGPYGGASSPWGGPPGDYTTPGAGGPSGGVQGLGKPPCHQKQQRGKGGAAAQAGGGGGGGVQTSIGQFFSKARGLATPPHGSVQNGNKQQQQQQDRAQQHQQWQQQQQHQQQQQQQQPGFIQPGGQGQQRGMQHHSTPSHGHAWAVQQQQQGWRCSNHHMQPGPHQPQLHQLDQHCQHHPFGQQPGANQQQRAQQAQQQQQHMHGAPSLQSPRAGQAPLPQSQQRRRLPPSMCQGDTQLQPTSPQEQQQHNQLGQQVLAAQQPGHFQLQQQRQHQQPQHQQQQHHQPQQWEGAPNLKSPPAARTPPPQPQQTTLPPQSVRQGHQQWQPLESVWTPSGRPLQQQQQQQGPAQTPPPSVGFGQQQQACMQATPSPLAIAGVGQQQQEQSGSDIVPPSPLTYNGTVQQQQQAPQQQQQHPGLTPAPALHPFGASAPAPGPQALPPVPLGAISPPAQPAVPLLAPLKAPAPLQPSLAPAAAPAPAAVAAAPLPSPLEAPASAQPALAPAAAAVLPLVPVTTPAAAGAAAAGAGAAAGAAAADAAAAAASGAAAAGPAAGAAIGAPAAPVEQALPPPGPAEVPVTAAPGGFSWPEPPPAAAIAQLLEFGIARQLLGSWVARDLEATQAYLEASGVVAGAGSTGVASQEACAGLLECFSFAQEVALQSGGSLAHFWQCWACQAPHGLLLAAAAARQLPINMQPLQGPWLAASAGWPLQLSLPCMKVAYQAVLAEGLPPMQPQHQRLQQQGHVGQGQQQQAHFQQQQQQQEQQKGGQQWWQQQPQAMQHQQQRQWQQSGQRQACQPIDPNTIHLQAPPSSTSNGTPGKAGSWPQQQHRQQQQQRNRPQQHQQQHEQQRRQQQQGTGNGGGAPGGVMRGAPPLLEMSQSAKAPKRAYRSSKALEAEHGQRGAVGGGGQGDGPAAAQQPQQRGAKRAKKELTGLGGGRRQINGGASAVRAAADRSDDDFV